AETALEVCMGDRGEYYARALSLLAEHRKQLREGIELMHDKGVEEMETFYFFDAGSEIKDSIVGIVAGMLYGSGAIQGNKPIVAFAMHEDNTVKISTRGTSELIRKGLNLGLALKETCAKLGDNAQGGGHKIAAGAKINENQKEDFLKIFNESLKNQITD
ncbi:MAG: DHHA1 domain-containing protein, partial [Candidatus Diapherotrites archaeon]